MRRPERPRIQRRWWIIGGIVFFLLVSIGSIVRFYTDLLWFDELGYVSVFWKILTTRVGVGVIGGLLAGIVVYLNLEIARRTAPRYRFVTAAGQDLAEQYRSAFRPYARLANFGLAGVVAFFTGASVSGAWERVLLWQNARPFGMTAPEPFGRDVSHYVFTIPFYRTVISWLFGIVVASLLLSVVVHLLNGSIQPEPNRIRIGMPVKIHVSALLGLFALLKAWSYHLDRYELVYSPRGTVTGASYTDVHAQLPALRFLTIIAIVAAVVFFVNVFRFQGWLLPGAAIALWVFSSVLAGALIPAAVQRFQVTPTESERERPYIQRNIEQTRLAFGLDRFDVRQFPAERVLAPETVAENQGTIDNVRIWDPTVLHPTYRRLQAIRTYYDFDDIDIDRYEIDGQLTQVMLSARELDATRLPGAQTWVNQRLSYTHGYGITANASAFVTDEGLPDFLVRDIPPRGPDELTTRQPGIYYGERLAEYAVANTRQEEIDYPRGDQDVVTTNYAGEGGIRTTGLLRRLAFAIRFADTDLLISNFITPESRVIMRRNIIERVQAAAPFLQYDLDPYVVVDEGSYKWIIDAYTTTDRFPYSEAADLGQIIGGRVQGQANYMRNSVKVVIDAYHGDTAFYVVDETDAIAATYQAAFPDLFRPISELPPNLERHLRYPEGLFKVQANQYRAYHILDPQRLYEREDIWDIPNDPVRSTDAQPVPMDPYYVMMKIPGEEREEFLLMIPFTPRGRPLLNGWVAARMDPGRYGEVISFSFPRGETIEGPDNISARIEQNDVIARQFTLWEGAGSRVLRGNLLVIPIGDALIYVQPIYLQAAEAARALPELRRVIVVTGDQIGFERTFHDSLEAAMRGTGPRITDDVDVGQPPAEEPDEPAPPAPTGDVAELLERAVQHFDRAEAALREGDLSTYQRENQAGQQAVRQAREQGG